jgi:hypothetical protein
VCVYRTEFFEFGVEVIVILAVVDHNRLIFLPGDIIKATIRSFNATTLIIILCVCGKSLLEQFLPSVVKHDNRCDDGNRRVLNS